MKQQVIEYTEFYLNHDCNLACSNCNRFNNFRITGSTNWETYLPLYKKWAKIVRFKRIGIIGGEPLLHPNIIKIMSDLRKLWPSAHITLHTNGILLAKKNSELIDAIIHNNIMVKVSVHNEKLFDGAVKNIQSCFGKFKAKLTLEPLKIIRGTTEKSVNFEIWLFYVFHQNSLIERGLEYTLHSSDPQISHAECDMKTCHHMWEGKLYKCGVALVLPHLLAQFTEKLVVSKEDKNLIIDYNPITVEGVKNDSNILKTLENPIDQCKFCPEKYEYSRIFQKKIA
jgi:uncharacterized Fe-S cluster-containing radical SAM superfamily protein